MTISIENGPIAHMWDCPRPRADAVGAGFPVLKNAVHTTIFKATRETGAYNHHSQLARHNGLFHAMWSNHPHGEDGPGQRILHTASPDGVSWPAPHELFPPPGPVKPSEETGLVCTALRWLVLNDNLYAVAGLHRNVGFTGPDHKLPPASKRDKQHPGRAREGYASLARLLFSDGTLGPIFAVGEKIPEDLAVTTATDPTGGRLRQAISHPDHLPAWDFGEIFHYPRAAEDGRRLCEPTVYQVPDGRYVMLLRDTVYSHRMYVSVSLDGGRTWPPAAPTDIPDSPSLSTNVVIDDGTVLLIGNQIAPEFDNADKIEHYGRDPLTVAVSRDGYLFGKVFALRCGVQNLRVPNVLGRGGGGQYPSAVVHAGRLYVLYSMGKEDEAVSSVALEDLGINAKVARIASQPP